MYIENEIAAEIRRLVQKLKNTRSREAAEQIRREILALQMELDTESDDDVNELMPIF